MSRELPEWIGKHDDQAIPPRVKLRVFDKFKGCCADCTRRIGGSLRPAYDHIKSLCNSGTHRESNLQLLCLPCHTRKTASDVAEKARTYRKRAAHVGVKFAPRQKIQSRGFNPVQSQRRASTPLNKWRGFTS